MNVENINTVFIIFRYVLIFTTIFCNFFLLLLILKVIKFKKNIYFQLVILINLSDVGVGIGSLLQAIFQTLERTSHYRTKLECHLISLPLLFGSSMEHWILIALAVDRLLALLYPIKYFAQSFRNLPLISALISLTLTGIYIICNVIDVNLYDFVQDCSVGVIRGNVGISYSYFAGVIILSGTIVIYLATVILFLKQEKKSTTMAKIQRQIFFNVSYLLLANIFVTLIPGTLFLIKDPTIKDAIAPAIVSLGMSATATFNACIILIKNHEIYKAMIKLLKSFNLRSTPVVTSLF